MPTNRVSNLLREEEEGHDIVSFRSNNSDTNFRLDE